MKIEKWKVYEQGDADEFCILMDDKRWVIAFRLNGELYREQQKRVVDMIAAAPEMLAALKALLKIIEDARADDGFDASMCDAGGIIFGDVASEAIEAAEAAIAKAGGRGDG